MFLVTIQAAGFTVQGFLTVNREPWNFEPELWADRHTFNLSGGAVKL